MAKPLLEKNSRSVLTGTPVGSSLPLGINGAAVGSKIPQLVLNELAKNTNKSIENIHATTSKAIADTHKNAVESISNIGVAHESKASEAIQAIERMNKSTLAMQVQEGSHNRGAIVNTLMATTLIALGATGAVLYIKNK